MYRKIIILIIMFSFLAAGLSVGLAEEAKEKKPSKEPKFDYVGGKRCMMCHKRDGIWESWEKSPHANAWNTLAKEAQKDEECHRCHATGVSAKGEFLPAVQCEACHGPGSGYSKLRAMTNRELAFKQGLRVQDDGVCIECHNESAPKICKVPKEHNFQKMFDEGVHIMPYTGGEEEND